MKHSRDKYLFIERQKKKIIELNVFVEFAVKRFVGNSVFLTRP